MHCGYNSGHCWYYLLGGAILNPKQIREITRRSSYKGFSEYDITKASQMAEPQRSAKLRQMKTRFETDLKTDIDGYHKRVLELHRYRLAHDITDNPVGADDVHVNLSLKHNHLVNGFAHLIYLDELLSQQGDLFG